MTLEHSIEVSEQEISVKDVPGIGPQTVKKLKEEGIETAKDLLGWGPNRLAEECNMSKETAGNHVNNARLLLVSKGQLLADFVPARTILNRRQALVRCSTGSQTLDNLLGGIGKPGIETTAVTEFYAEFGAGKSQVAHTLSVLSQAEVEQGGLGGKVLYIDTEGTFRPERIMQIAQARGLDPDKIIDGITVCRVYNSSHFELIVKDLNKYVRDTNSKLVIVDSIIARHRADFEGRGQLAERQQALQVIIQKLIMVAELSNVAVVITNQVTDNPDQSAMFTDPKKATGGNIIAHASTYRIYITKSGHNRIATFADSPMHAWERVKFRITERGVDDVEEDKK